jgi:hypothetical protein
MLKDNQLNDAPGALADYDRAIALNPNDIDRLFADGAGQVLCGGDYRSILIGGAGQVLCDG